MGAKKILMLVGDLVEDYEAMVPYQILTMVGHTVDTVCPGKKVGETVKTAVHDFEGDQTYSEKRGHNFAITATFEGIKPEDYDGLVIPGGRAPEYLRLDEGVIEVTRHFVFSNKPIASFATASKYLSPLMPLKGKHAQLTPRLNPISNEPAGNGGRLTSHFPMLTVMATSSVPRPGPLIRSGCRSFSRSSGQGLNLNSDGFVKSPNSVPSFIPCSLKSREARRQSRFNRVNHCSVL